MANQSATKATTVVLPKPRPPVVTAIVRYKASQASSDDKQSSSRRRGQQSASTREQTPNTHGGIAVLVSEETAADAKALAYFCAARLGFESEQVLHAVFVRPGDASQECALLRIGAAPGSEATTVRLPPLQRGDIVEIWVRDGAARFQQSRQLKQEGEVSPLRPPAAAGVCTQGSMGNVSAARYDATRSRRRRGSPRALRLHAQALLQEVERLGLVVPPLESPHGPSGPGGSGCGRLQGKPQKFFRDSCRGNTRDIKRRRKRELTLLFTLEVDHLEALLGAEVSARIAAELSQRIPKELVSFGRCKSPEGWTKPCQNSDTSGDEDRDSASDGFGYDFG